MIRSQFKWGKIYSCLRKISKKETFCSTFHQSARIDGWLDMNFQLTWQKMPVYITTMHSHLLLLKVCKRNFQLNGNFLFPYLGTILHPHLRLCRRNYRQNTKNRKLEIALNFKLSALGCCQIDLVLK